MTVLQLNHTHLIDSQIFEVTTKVHVTAESMKLPYFIVGATARDILLSGVFGITTGRATRDVDFAIAVESWVQFDALKAALLATDLFAASPKATHRLTFLPSDMPLDIIPFGGVEHENHQIAWPPDMNMIMNMVGYAEALSHAVSVKMDENTIISVASLPGLALLKLFSWVDRGRETPKDAIDLVTLFRCYADAGNMDRLYEADYALLDSVNHDLALASPRLLGADVGRMATDEIRNMLFNLLRDPVKKDRLCTDMSRELKHEADAFQYAEQLISQFCSGLAGE